MADSVAIMGAILSLSAGAVVIIFGNKIIAPILDRAAIYSSGYQASMATDWLRTGLDFWPVVFLLTVLFGLIVISVYRRPGGIR